MIRAIVVAGLALVACGDNVVPEVGPLIYTDPAGGALRLVRDPTATPTAMRLDLVVGDQPLIGYSTGFDLPIDVSLVQLSAFTPGVALDPGSAPVAAKAVVPSDGTLRGMLVAAQSQKAAGAGAIPGDAMLVPGSVLFTIELVPVGTRTGIVFDGTAPAFVLPSGGLRTRTGETVVSADAVAIGKLVVKLP